METHRANADGPDAPRQAPSFKLADPSAPFLSFRLSPQLITSRQHEVLFADRRMHFIFLRLQGISTLLCLATIGWIPVDFLLFHDDWNVVLPIALGRVATAALFAAIGYLHRRRGPAQQGIWGIALAIGVGIGFFAFVHIVIAIYGPAHLSESAHAQYLMLPIVLTAGIAIFPLTLIEVAGLSGLPFLALTVEFLWSDAGSVWSQEIAAMLMLCTIIIVAIVCALSQLRLLIDLHERSIMDTLTGAMSRQAGMQMLEILFSISTRTRAPLALLFVDLDRFKTVNDGFGHDAGDRVLSEVARRIKARLRRQDAFIRWGGEEFLLALSNTDIAGATRLTIALGRAGFGLRPDRSPQTASIGAAERIADAARSWASLVEIADKRMYEAKQLGRNRLVAPGPVVERLPDADLAAT